MNNVSELLTKTETLKGESQTIFFSLFLVQVVQQVMDTKSAM